NLFLLCILAFVGLFLCRGPEDKGIIFVPCVNGASRWFYLNPAPLPQIPFLGTFGFQPGELIKLTVILYLSFQLNKIRRKKMPESEGFTVYLTTVLVLLGLFFMQPNMSTAILVFLICTSIYWVSDYPLKNMFTFFPVMGVIGLIGVFSSSYRRDRLFTLLQGGEGSDTSLGYHIKQVLIALGTGGFFGVGFGQSRQKYQYLPEVSSDSIFAIIGEEFGFIGTCAVLLVFAFLLYKGLEIAKNAESDLGKMLAVGFTSWIGFQLFINVAAMTKLIPLTGVPIPLISYGGSSIVFSLAGLGILASVQKQSQ
ncbi:FtsW/RodA/SpoVE family cell cycle protein, partial [Patescibacteria group bacterium]|nr:FtsW/RodA/SpoVE family cell cycle protein [Patescibacteria group bacterium]